MKIIQHPLPFWDERPQKIDSIVLHCSAHEPPEMFRVLQDRKLSTHYVIGSDGQIFQSVPEEKRAWHAGVSYWRGQSNLNHRSIGIELSSATMGQGVYPKIQIKSLIELCKDILQRYPAIIPINIVAHSDVAPTRKPDPGPSFPWQQLAQNGIGLWYNIDDAGKMLQTDIAELLAIIGYECDNLAAASYAFCRRFAPNVIAFEKDNVKLIENVFPRDFVLPLAVLPILKAVAYRYQ